MARLFGTDGVRGVANADLTAELAMELSTAAAKVLGEAGAFTGRRPTALVGRDTRISGELLSAAVNAGLASTGVDVIDVGVVPTPGLAYLVNKQGTDLGVMLSASHNPMPDNGIKFFQRGGVKLDDTIEDSIEERLNENWSRPVAGDVGRIDADEGHALRQGYIDYLVSSLEDTRLDGLKVVIDAANGAASFTAVPAFEAAGATVIGIHNTPDGLNINDHAGSTHIESLQAKVVAEGADLGIALDGDADRCLAVDASGAVVDGDHVMAILALDLKEQGKLHNNTLVATIMSNLGLINAMRENGIQVEQTRVGDRYVLETMASNGFTLGGEQSGHVIISEYANTGDGVLTGLHVAARVARCGRPLTELASVMTTLPQVMINVPNVDKMRAGIDPEITRAVTQANNKLGDNGRVVLRPSGTEPLVRVMVEAATSQDAQQVAEELAALVATRLAL
ncbi:phosphoglucosamine mutase [Propionimicrobium sp. PCR01-08-3]|uniref:phosphoglucosamine mutase n=1 Tax=Propionimicrobium sp. PCR01-08-3 TaxID=3052086 RepID=UPI00255D120B|nr:phosphoglucosamine mutase [Propionimicrobium sp. PCR01-08-3]WIY83237.1 phosphoglucosamine mutase [Propionimicrobium sp. PCR01-08-3]